MNAQSFYRAVETQMHKNRKGRVYAIAVRTGTNKGKIYPYSSIRQTRRQIEQVRASDAELYAAWDREDGTYGKI